MPRHRALYAKIPTSGNSMSPKTCLTFGATKLSFLDSLNTTTKASKGSIKPSAVTSRPRGPAFAPL
eukprot:4662196-Amphidinium_carterae.1